MRKEVIIYIEMTQEQKDLAKSILEKNLDALIAFEKGKKTTELATVNNLFTLMRQIVNHNLMLSNEYATDCFRSKKLC